MVSEVLHPGLLWFVFGHVLFALFLELRKHSSAPCGTAVRRRIRESAGPEIEIQDYLACPRRIVGCVPGLRRRKMSEASILLGVLKRAWRLSITEAARG